MNQLYPWPSAPDMSHDLPQMSADVRQISSYIETLILAVLRNNTMVLVSVT